MHLILSLCMMLCAGRTAKAQNYTYPSNSEYVKTVQYEVDDDAAFGTDAPRAILTMDCLAANGYGQWTVSSNVGYSSNLPNVSPVSWWLQSSGQGQWFLLGNLIGPPSLGIDGTSDEQVTQPPGIVAGGDFEVPTGLFPPNTIKVTANVTGSVRYVWRTPSMDAFVVEGLNDDQGVTGTHDPEIDIALTKLPYPDINRSVIKNPIFSSYPPVSTLSGGITHFISNNDVDHRDEFDIACDKNYLYIVWESAPNPMQLPNSKEIWATAVEIKTGAPLTGFPILVAGGGTELSWKFPTVACNVRNSPTSPQFDVAYLDALTSTVIVKEYFGTAILSGHTEVLPKLNYDPNGPYSPGPPTVGLDQYSAALHARVLVSSVAESTAPDVHCVYVISRYMSGLANDLLLYKPLNWINDKAVYVDGIRTNSAYHLGVQPFPSPLSTTGFSTVSVKDEHIIAFANPYDAQYVNSRPYDEFHCLYQLIHTADNGLTVDYSPLILVNGYNNGFANTGGSSDTRLLLNQDLAGVVPEVLSDPTTTEAVPYIGAVNQMGIHVHWRTDHPLGIPSGPKQHYYIRNIRSFDEPIEENTLATNDCYVADGSEHGGTVGATLQTGRKMTLWTDPNYDFNLSNGSSGNGLYWREPETAIIPGYYGKLNEGGIIYLSDGLQLSIGNNWTTVPLSEQQSNATLYTYPSTYFGSGGSATDGGNLTVFGGSQWHYFGNPTLMTTTPNFSTTLVPGTTHLTNNGDELAGLYIHGEATFPARNFTSVGGKINILYEEPIHKMSVLPVSGLFLVATTATLTDSKVNSYLPDYAFINVITTTDDITNFEDVVMEIAGYGVASTSGYSLISTNTDYTNNYTSSGPGGSVILYNAECTPSGSPIGPNLVWFDGGSMKDVRFHALNPTVGGLRIENMTIDGWHEYMIHLERICGFDYNGIEIANNDFHSVEGVLDPDYGIRIEGFNKSDRYGAIDINDNIFRQGGDSDLADGAIEFINTTGNIVGNSITGSMYNWGITLTSTDGNPTFSYLCSNDISDITGFREGVGILSDHYFGIVKLCRINGCDIGYNSGSGFEDNPLIIATSILNSSKEGINVDGNGASHISDVDLTGVHGGGNDYAAFDTITGTTATSHAQVELADASQLITYGPPPGNPGTWNNWGEDNTIGTTGAPLAIGGGAATIGNIDKNFWGNSVNPLPFPNNAIIASGITYNGNATNTETTETAWSGSISCSGGFTTIHQAKNIDAQSMVEDTLTECMRLFGWSAVRPQDQETALQQYDSLRKYVEDCAASDNSSWQVFIHLVGAVALMSDDTTRYDIFRDWLISVLYLNTTNPQYFCACMGAISDSYQYGKYTPLGGLAVDDYIRKNHPECWGASGDAAFSRDSAYDSKHGHDASQLPPLDSLGLGFLLNQNSVAPDTYPSSTYLASFTGSPNPFTKSTDLKFTLNRMTYVTIAIYDELGRMYWGDGKGRSLDMGTHTIHIDGADLPSGTLYARISTGFGEVKTVKLIKN